MSEEDRERLQNDAGKNWDDFYGTHKNHFFKDRNWLFTEYPELSAYDDGEERSLLEIGCGAGNTVYPILERMRNPRLTVFCCDYSPNAVELVRKCKDFEPDRCRPFVLDASKSDWSADVPFAPGSLDCALLIFMLSAMEPGEQMRKLARRLFAYLKPGGLVLFRDYGQYDLAQLRFKEGRCIADNFYARGDGTRCYFFSQADVTALFTEAGFEEVQNRLDTRLQVNRGKQQKMYRVWVQAKYRKPSD